MDDRRWWRTRRGRLRGLALMVGIALAALIALSVATYLLPAGGPLHDAVIWASIPIAIVMVAASAGLLLEVWHPIHTHGVERREALRLQVMAGRSPREVRREYRKAIAQGRISPYPGPETDDAERAIARLVSGGGRSAQDGDTRGHAPR